jgi:hypothetical protein
MRKGLEVRILWGVFEILHVVILGACSYISARRGGSEIDSIWIRMP